MEIVKKVLEILHRDGFIECNQYQGEDFEYLIKRLKMETIAETMINKKELIEEYQKVIKQLEELKQKVKDNILPLDNPCPKEHPDYTAWLDGKHSGFNDALKWVLGLI